MAAGIWCDILCCRSVGAGECVNMSRAKWASEMISPAERRHSLVGPAALWQMKRAFQIGFLRSVGLLPDHYLLDLGCGTLRGGIPIIEYLEPGHYYGVEPRYHVLQEGRQELIESGLQDRLPHLIHADRLRDCDLGRHFDIVWAFSVLIHLTDEILNTALAFVKRHLSPDGSFYANVNIGEASHDGSWQGFPHVYRSVKFYQGACLNAGLSLQLMGSLRELGHVSGNPGLGDAQQMLQVKRL